MDIGDEDIHGVVSHMVWKYEETTRRKVKLIILGIEHYRTLRAESHPMRAVILIREKGAERMLFMGAEVVCCEEVPSNYLKVFGIDITGGLGYE